MSLMQPLQSSAMLDVIRERDEAIAELERGGRPGVSVCVPCYQQSTTLERTLISIKNQTLPALETIVVNDGSDPLNTALIERLCKQYGAHYYRVTNRGLPNARNTGLMLARGDMFLPLDSDDSIHHEYLERTVPLIKSGADVVQVGLQEVGPYRKGEYPPGYDRPVEQVTVDLLWRSNHFFYCALLRTKLMREIGGWNGRMSGGLNPDQAGYEDWTTWIDLLKRGAKVVGVPQTLFFYTTAPDSMVVRAERHKAALVHEMRRHHA